MIEELLAILKPFTIDTTVLSGSSYVTISTVCPVIYNFCSSLDGKEGDCENCKQIKTAIQSDIKECYKRHTAKTLQELAFLDPRFKNLNFLFNDEIEGVEVKRYYVQHQVILCHVRTVSSVKWSLISQLNHSHL